VLDYYENSRIDRIKATEEVCLNLTRSYMTTSRRLCRTLAGIKNFHGTTRKG